MSGQTEYKFRQVVPRLSTFSTAKKYKDASLIGSGLSFESDLDYATACKEWPGNKNVLSAADLVGSALLFGDFANATAIDAANFIKRSKHASAIATEAADRLLQTSQISEVPDPFDIHRTRAKIAALKLKLNDRPRDPLRWCDLAFHYAVLSQDAQASRAMRAAVFQTHNSYILRSAARLFFHLNDAEQALSILRRSARVKYDPLVAATEIAIADVFDLPTKSIKSAVSMLSSGDFSTRQLAELASVLGSLEFKAGALKHGRRYFQKALLEPNENILAQAEWLAPRFNIQFDTPSLESIPATFEATMVRARKEGQYEKVVESAEKWLIYQPFSSMPAVAGSFTSAVCLRDFPRAISIARRGLLSSPDEFMLKNNLASAYACNGDIEQAENIFIDIDPADLVEAHRFTYTATKGLIKFRRGEFEEGRKLYDQAIKGFEEHGMRANKAIALLFWAFEETRIKATFSNPLFEESKKLAKELNFPELLFVPELKEDRK